MKKLLVLAAVLPLFAGCVSRTYERDTVVEQKPTNPSTVVVPQGSTSPPSTTVIVPQSSPPPADTTIIVPR